MKKKDILHPKLYLDVVCYDGCLHLNFISNKFDINGIRRIEKETVENDSKINKKNIWLILICYKLFF